MTLGNNENMLFLSLSQLINKTVLIDDLIRSVPMCNSETKSITVTVIINFFALRDNKIE